MNKQSSTTPLSLLQKDQLSNREIELCWKMQLKNRQRKNWFPAVKCEKRNIVRSVFNLIHLTGPLWWSLLQFYKTGYRKWNMSFNCEETEWAPLYCCMWCIWPPLDWLWHVVENNLLLFLELSEVCSHVLQSDFEVTAFSQHWSGWPGNLGQWLHSTALLLAVWEMLWEHPSHQPQRKVESPWVSSIK